jgi:hypothetical protein
MRGGGTNYLPLPRDVTNATEFAEKFNLIAMTAHGSQDGQVFLVPENTWILFRGPASASIERRKKQDEILNQFRFLQPGETDADYYNRIYSVIHDRTLFREFLFSPEDPFQPGKMSIYEPGDVIQNVEFSIHNFQYPFGLIGVWKLPLASNVLDMIEDANDSYSELLNLIEMTGLNDAKKSYVMIQANENLKHIETDLMGHENNAMFKMGLNEPNSSIHDILQKRTYSSMVSPPQFLKRYTFIVIESCRASEDIDPRLGLHIRPENVEALEKGPNAFESYLRTGFTKPHDVSNATYEKGMKNIRNGMIQSIKRSRRLSLGVRHIPETCYKSLFMLSRQNLMRLRSTLSGHNQSILDALLAGRLVPKGAFIELTKGARNMNTRLLNLSSAERFFVGEGVQVGDDWAVVIGVEVQRGAGNSSQVIYRVRFADGHEEPKHGEELTRMNQEEFAGIRMSLNQAQQNALTGPATGAKNVEELAGNVVVSSQTLLFPEYGLTFFVPPTLVSKIADIKREMSKYTFRPREIVKIKSEPKGSLAGKEVEITDEIQYVDGKGFRYTVYIVDEKRTIPINPVMLEKKALGGGKTRRKGLASKFCRCIKQVRKTVRLRGRAKTKRAKESAAIGICTKSVLQRRGHTLKRFKCTPKPVLNTQKYTK